MSWIKLDNGDYVKDPIFYGKEWFLDCRSDEPMLVVHIYRNPSEKGLLKRMRKILREQGVPATIVAEEAHRDRSVFPPNFKGLKQSASVRLELRPLALPAQLFCHTGVRATLRPEEDVLNECVKDSVSVSKDGARG